MDLTTTLNTYLLPVVLFGIYFVTACLIVHQFNLRELSSHASARENNQDRLPSSSSSALPAHSVQTAIPSTRKEISFASLPPSRSGVTPQETMKQPPKTYKLRGEEVVLESDLKTDLPSTVKRYRLRGKTVVKVQDLINWEQR